MRTFLHEYVWVNLHELCHHSYSIQYVLSWVLPTMQVSAQIMKWLLTQHNQKNTQAIPFMCWECLHVWACLPIISPTSKIQGKEAPSWCTCSISSQCGSVTCSISSQWISYIPQTKNNIELESPYEAWIRSDQLSKVINTNPRRSLLLYNWLADNHSALCHIHFNTLQRVWIQVRWSYE